ncbi:RHD3/Sey1, partial [Thamnocephalis sphaerospora]
YASDINQCINSWGMARSGRDYHIITIFGSQSTGKSTLLNALFGTDFSTMDPSAGRNQTTLGIWMGKSSSANILVMDVEGVDGQERGEDKLIECRSALFSLAIAEVLVINMYETTIGLYGGANIELLKAVFEANLRLSQGKEQVPAQACKTLLLFVVRDFTGQTPLVHHEDKLRKNMTKIWDNMIKPKHLERSSFSNFFDCMVAELPPKPFMPDQFNEAVDKLRLRFTDPNHSDYVFKPCYHRSIPIDGFSHYASGVWAMLANRTLSIPTQQMLLAEHRCAEFRSEAEAAFKQSVNTIAAQINDGKVVDELGKLMEKARGEAIAMFDANAKHYHHDVYTKMHDTLYTALNEELSILFRTQLKSLTAELTEQIDTEMRSLRAGSADLFMAKAGKIRQKISQTFKKAASSAYQVLLHRVACLMNHSNTVLMLYADYRYAY